MQIEHTSASISDRQGLPLQSSMFRPSHPLDSAIPLSYIELTILHHSVTLDCPRLTTVSADHMICRYRQSKYCFSLLQANLPLALSFSASVLNSDCLLLDVCIFLTLLRIKLLCIIYNNSHTAIFSHFCYNYHLFDE